MNLKAGLFSLLRRAMACSLLGPALAAWWQVGAVLLVTQRAKELLVVMDSNAPPQSSFNTC